MKFVLKKLINFVKSPKFFVGIIVLYLLQGLFFTVAVNPSDIYVIEDGTVTRGGGVVPDGNRHIGAIYYYAQQPIENGPFITDMTDSELWMGDLERFPSYLYYYLLGLIMKIPLALQASDFVNVMIIRLVGLVIGLLALLVFRKIVREITTNKLIGNLTVLGLAVTGSFAWLSPAENYDILALLFFFLFMLASLRLFTRQDPTQSYWMFVWFCLGSITKYTYIPFMGLFGLVAVGLYVRKSGGVRRAWLAAKEKLASRVRSLSKLAGAGLVILLIIAGGLFAERIGVNLVEYRSFSPDCEVVHSHEGCMNFGVYERNYNRQQLVQSKETTYTFDPGYFTQLWLFKYYTSMYAYVGHIWIENFSLIMFSGLAIVVASLLTMIVYLKYRKVKIFDSITARYTGFVVVVLIVAQYLFNANGFIAAGGVAYATQGRYLLPAIGFVYLLLLIVAVKFYRNVPKTKKRSAAMVLVVLAVIALLTNSALPVFLLHATSPEWFSWT